MDAVHGEMLEPCSGALRKVEWQILDDEKIIIRSTWPTGKAEVFQTYGRVGVPRVLIDVWQCTEGHWKWRMPDPFCERLRATGI